MIRNLILVFTFLLSSSAKAVDVSPLQSVDFEVSLGKGDLFFDNYYTECMNASHTRDSYWALLTGANRPICSLVHLCRQLYHKNKALLPSRAPRIPLKIHQIWLGSPLPEKYKALQKTWQSLPGFTYKLWTDKDVEQFDFEAKDIYHQAKNYGQRADILRMAILDRYGGVYVDMDFECITPPFFTILNSTYDFYAGLHPLDAKVFALENALIGSIAGHPIIKAYLRDLPKAWKQQTYNAYAEIVIKTGPGLFTRAFYKEAGKKYKDIALPPTFLYPLGLAQWEILKRFTFETIRKQVLKPESAAIHWWHGTWKESNAYIQTKRIKHR